MINRQLSDSNFYLWWKNVCKVFNLVPLNWQNSTILLTIENRCLSSLLSLILADIPHFKTIRSWGLCLIIKNATVTKQYKWTHFKQGTEESGTFSGYEEHTLYGEAQVCNRWDDNIMRGEVMISICSWIFICFSNGLCYFHTFSTAFGWSPPFSSKWWEIVLLIFDNCTAELRQYTQIWCFTCTLNMGLFISNYE